MLLLLLGKLKLKGGQRLVVTVAFYIISKYDINFRRATRETWDSRVNFFLPLFLVAYK